LNTQFDLVGHSAAEEFFAQSTWPMCVDFHFIANVPLTVMFSGYMDPMLKAAARIAKMPVRW